MSEQTAAATCPYCGLPKDRHTYVSRTTCVVAGPPLPVSTLHHGGQRLGPQVTTVKP